MENEVQIPHVSYTDSEYDWEVISLFSNEGSPLGINSLRQNLSDFELDSSSGSEVNSNDINSLRQNVSDIELDSSSEREDSSEGINSPRQNLNDFVLDFSSESEESSNGLYSPRQTSSDSEESSNGLYSPRQTSSDSEEHSTSRSETLSDFNNEGDSNGNILCNFRPNSFASESSSSTINDTSSNFTEDTPGSYLDGHIAHLKQGRFTSIPQTRKGPYISSINYLKSKNMMKRGLFSRFGLCSLQAEINYRLGSR